MINLVKNWCEGIIIAVIISVIIELLVPEGNNKKYVKIVIGIYLIFVIINPILKFTDYDFNFENIINFESIETSNNLNENIKDVYILGIEQNIKEEIEELGYILEKVQLVVDDNYEDIKQIEIIIGKNKKNIKIDPIIINDENEKYEEYKEIIEILKTNYLVKEEQIIIRKKE